MEFPAYINDEELLAGIANGDQQAFRVVFRLHYRALCYFAASITADAQEAEDLAQEAFSTLWNKRADFGSLPAIRAFLYITVKNAGLNAIRSKNRQTSRETEFAYLHNDAPGQFDPLLADTEIIQAIYEEIERLPPQCRRIFSMSYLQGKKNDEIAALLDISYNTVRTQKLRALRLLRAALLKKHLLPAALLYMAFIKMR